MKNNLIIFFVLVTLLCSCSKNEGENLQSYNSAGYIAELYIAEEPPTIVNESVITVVNSEKITNSETITNSIIETTHSDYEYDFENEEFLKILSDLTYDINFIMPLYGYGESGYTVWEEDWFYEDFNYKFRNGYYIASRCVNQSELEKYEDEGWLELSSDFKFGARLDSNNRITELPKPYNLYALIKHFALKWEDIEIRLYEEEKDFIESDLGIERFNNEYMSREEWNVLFNGSEEEIVKCFVAKTAIAIDNRIFAADWVYYASISDYIENRITPQMLKDMMPIYKEMIFGEADFIPLQEYAFITLKYKFSVYEELVREAESIYLGSDPLPESRLLWVPRR